MMMSLRCSHSVLLLEVECCCYMYECSQHCPTLTATVHTESGLISTLDWSGELDPPLLSSFACTGREEGRAHQTNSRHTCISA